MDYDVLIVGGGAAGFFAAIHIAETKPKLKIAILEKGKEVLTKVKISGGGRCNVTHAEFVPNELAKYYPRGEKELKGPFHTFCSGDTIAFFEKRGVALKIEEDGRMFPTSDSSQTIIDCFLHEVNRLGVSVLTGHVVKRIERQDNWLVETSKGEFSCKKLLIASGSSPKVWRMIKDLGHSLVTPVPSLFTFNINDQRIKSLPGLSTMGSVKILGTHLNSEGPVLITHWGLSGPAILKLSAWGARDLNALDYKFKIQINWLYNQGLEEALEELKLVKANNGKKLVVNIKPFEIPKRLWFSLLNASGITDQMRWAEVSKQQLMTLASQLTQSVYDVDGKSTFKEEFVTAGGVDLKEVDFKTYQSKIQKDLYFAGEVLNIDAITGGFNFQNAWTGAFIAAKAIAD
ncbi:BaiN/RdsA family NAD(P)/FAD-dependent oxidoreductase [Zhouia amylolytica]|uniref:Flavoprotein, HI0933 family n=1 Tax=Zhouia amylolytica AD3 TaxID=1286632 RepID=W2UII9_9FLAO|nr:NAD(P)/FAD-dependent oxidoreductase [Zhouia amylolytica]ETN93818.1 flavoprotein, HI0933 family [Zhouia amylolytica AD3]